VPGLGNLPPLPSPTPSELGLVDPPISALVPVAAVVAS
jgi:hypothetical protein